MKIFISEGGRVIETHDGDGIDIVTKRYQVRVRLSDVRIIRNARPKKNLPPKVIYAETLDLTEARRG